MKVNLTLKIVKNQTLLKICLLFFAAAGTIYGQQAPESGEPAKVAPLFQSEEPLPVRLRYSDKDMRKDTNDSTYIMSMMGYQKPDGSWDSLEIRAHARGNWRRENCFLTPVMVKFKKKDVEGTVFEGQKEMKLVLPCRNNDLGQDYVVKEYMAYKIYEPISPFHFKTRRLAIEMTDDKGSKSKTYQVEGFLIEDIDEIADRFEANKMKRNVHPLQQDDLTSVQNDFFQYLIGNTDFSSAYQHNEKLLFVKGRQAIPIPYDFDMCGLVNANYAVVSEIQGEVLALNSVTERLFRGFKRDPALFEQVRQQYRDQRGEIMRRVEALKSSFRNEKQYEEARNYVVSFFTVLDDPAKYQSEILNKAREK